jgi:hypothetical protein
VSAQEHGFSELVRIGEGCWIGSRVGRYRRWSAQGRASAQGREINDGLVH